MEALTIAEQTRRDELENQFVAHVAAGCDAYLQAGKCLAEILDSRLYRSEYATFEDYVTDFWQISPYKARRWAEAWRVAANIQAQSEDVPLIFWNAMEGFCESHARVLRSLPPEQQAEAWSVAKEVSPSPTAKLLKEVAAKFKDGYEQIDNMTQTEELVFLKNVERESSVACELARKIEAAKSAAKLTMKVVQTVEKHPEFADGVELLRKAHEMFVRVGSVEEGSMAS